MVAVAIPGSLEIRTMSPVAPTSSGIALRPVGPVGPVDLAAVGAERALHELPLVGDKNGPLAVTEQRLVGSPWAHHWPTKPVDWLNGLCGGAADTGGVPQC